MNMKGEQETFYEPAASVKLANHFVTDKNAFSNRFIKSRSDNFRNAGYNLSTPSPGFDLCEIVKVIPGPECPIRDQEGAETEERRKETTDNDSMSRCLKPR